MTTPDICPLGDRGLCIDWGNVIDPGLHARVLHLFDQIRQAQLPGVLDLTPAYSTLTLLFDAAFLLRNYPGQLPHELLRRRVEPFLAAAPDTWPQEGPLREIPVCYAPEFAPDLEELARRCGLLPREVVELHTAPTYRVYLLGFLPGFPYLGSVDRRIAAPRRESPRPRVPAGSVGIAGEQTGVYSLESPGGWNLIGRTPLRLFDASLPEPALLRVGEQVRFFEITPAEFNQIKRAQP
ncbi:MAG: 5-oxoprolinase subunit PxpB [Saprospiraceae bacterium]|nr:5-oxoprolinase subunit PxpB [Saprospiraceae bacterium]